MKVRVWWRLPCGCPATDGALIVAEWCPVHQGLVPEGGVFGTDGQYGPVDLPAAIRG